MSRCASRRHRFEWDLADPPFLSPFGSKGKRVGFDPEVDPDGIPFEPKGKGRRWRNALEPTRRTYKYYQRSSAGMAIHAPKTVRDHLPPRISNNMRMIPPRHRTFIRRDGKRVHLSHGGVHLLRRSEGFPGFLSQVRGGAAAADLGCERDRCRRTWPFRVLRRHVRHRRTARSGAHARIHGRTKGAWTAGKDVETSCTPRRAARRREGGLGNVG